MGKFLNTQYRQNVDSLVEGFKENLRDNPYYMYSENVATTVTYYKQNIEASTLDEALKIAQDQKGEDSPIRYNRIEDFFLYGVEQILVELENDEFGLASSSLEGEGYVLPNSIIPIPGDFFSINYLDVEYTFKVLTSTQDTLESGANFFKITWKYDGDSADSILMNVVADFNMLATNVGSDFKVVIESNAKDYIVKLEEITIRLKKYFKDLFYNNRVQTYTYAVNEDNFYDPFMIEFMIKNGVLVGDEEFISLTHQTHLKDNFKIEYDASFLRSIELRDPKKLNKSLHGNANLIEQPLSIFYTRKENYFEVAHLENTSGTPGVNEFDIFDLNLYDSIRYNYKYSNVTIEDFIVKYFNREIYTAHDLELFNELDYTPSKKLFYMIPLLIYCIEEVIKDILLDRIKVPNVNMTEAPASVYYNTEVVRQYVDIIYTYFVGEVSSDSGSKIWIVNRYDKDNNMKIAITYDEPQSLTDCQILTYV